MYIVNQTSRPPMPIAIAAGRTVSARGTAMVRPNTAPMPPPTMPGEHLRERDPLDPAFDDAHGAFERPAEDPAGQVADETAQHSADSGQLGARRGQVLADHEPGRGEQHDGEESGDLDEHGASLPNPKDRRERPPA